MTTIFHKSAKGLAEEDRYAFLSFMTRCLLSATLTFVAVMFIGWLAMFTRPMMGGLGILALFMAYGAANWSYNRTGVPYQQLRFTPPPGTPVYDNGEFSYNLQAKPRVGGSNGGHRVT